ncbi:MAG: hypothetical protein LBK53_05435 [Heliobacteriaceae bacterium]|jgi:hypothetical protein|nr:hypothetical protein [Heliobacteriaceae bacterium]
MKKPYTLDDFDRDNFTPEEIEQMDREVAEEVAKIRGGKRAGAGRKPKTGFVLQFQVRLSEKEKEFIQYAREHNINYDNLMRKQA